MDWLAHVGSHVSGMFACSAELLVWLGWRAPEPIGVEPS